jgi:hypothetical protein
MHAALRSIYYVIGVIFVIVGLLITFSTGTLGLIVGSITIMISIYAMNIVRKNTQNAEIQYRLREWKKTRSKNGRTA